MEGVGCRRPVGVDKGVVMDSENGNRLDLTAVKGNEERS